MIERGYVAMTVVLLAACGHNTGSGQPANSPPSSVPDLDQKVGWYRMPAGDTALLTYSSTGGLRLFSLRDTVYWATFVPGPDGLHWGDASGPAIEWQRSNGEAAGFEWTSATGERKSAVRVHAHGYDVEEVTISSDDTRLSGSLFIPAGVDRPFPAAVMIHGSGASDRDNAWYMMIADALVRSGIAVLLPDKRGSGKSEGNWFTTDLSGFGADAVAQIRYLRGHAAVDSTRVGFVGLSQGGHIAPMVANHSRAAFVVNVSGSATPLAEQIVHEVTQDMKRDRLPGILDPVVRKVSLWTIRRRRPEWWRTNGPIDPLDHWQTVAVPALVVYGEDDEVDNVPVRRSVQRLQSLEMRNLEVWVFAGSGHALWEPDGRLRVRRDFLERLTEWMLNATSADSVSPATRLPGDSSVRSSGDSPI
jgi:hypothetical protein